MTESVSSAKDSEPASDPSALCRWSKAKSYAEFKQIALFNYDLPDSVYEPTSYNGLNLTPLQIQEDLACLRLILTQLYSGTPVFKQEGIDLVANLDKMSELLKNNGSPTSTAVLGSVIQLIWGKAFDGHFGVQLMSYKDFYAGKHQGVGYSLLYPIFIFTTESISGRNIESCDSLHLSKSFGGPSDSVFTGYLPGKTNPVPKTVACKSKSGETIQLAIKSLTAAEAVKHPDDDHAKGAILTSTADGIDILKITSFPEPATDEQRAIAKTIAMTDRPLIIDVRGDGGGAPEFNQLLQGALFSADQNLEYSTVHAKYGWLRVLAVTQMWKDMDQDSRFNPAVSSAKREASHRHYEELITGWESESLSELAAEGISSLNQSKIGGGSTRTSGMRSSPRKAPVVILTDRNCGSQCDFFVSAVRHLPTAEGHILGIPTAGRMNFGNEGKLFLPNSHLAIMPSIASNDHLPPAIEGQGIQPDLYVLNGDVQSEALVYMRQLLQK